MAKGRQTTGDRGKQTRSRPSKEDSQEAPASQIPEQLQQHVLNIFRDAFFQDKDFPLEVVVQKVKQHLYDRDFTAAFGSDRNLLAYAARWSSYRSLGYLQIFQDISEFVTESTRTSSRTSKVDAVTCSSTASDKDNASEKATDVSAIGAQLGSVDISQDDKAPAYDAKGTVPAYEHPPAYGTNASGNPVDDEIPQASLTITFLGGGAGAELVASAAWLRLQTEASDESTPDSFGQAPVEDASLEVHCVDIADWAHVVEKLDDAVKTAPAISKYASAAVQAANLPLLPSEAMRAHFTQQDILETSPDSMRALFQSSDLITIMFTLNELYSTSVSKTQRLLFELTVAASPGTLLLVVDSPGSYSSVRLNNAEKKYPMQWLLDHTLLEASKNTRLLPRGDHWEKLLTDESRWFRVPQGLRYPIELENMRYQIHLYRRLAVAEDNTTAEPSVSKPQR